MKNRILCWCLLITVFVISWANRQSIQAQSRPRHKPAAVKAKKSTQDNSAPGEIVGRRIRFVDGSSIVVDEVWKQNSEVWYRTGNISQSTDRQIRTIEPVYSQSKSSEVAAQPVVAEPTPQTPPSFLIYLKGGARVKAENVRETSEGAWYERGTLSVFLERERIARIERELVGPKKAGWRERGWTTGSERIDELIRANGVRFAVDPYLIFCVIEHESHFRVRAVSPKGARGLMQLMPGTARRFGVRRVFDPAENIFGGTQYLKELLRIFDGKLELALASYNAGEGAVFKYGRNVPPYKETREYVRRVTRRYGADSPDSTDKNSPR